MQSSDILFSLTQNVVKLENISCVIMNDRTYKLEVTSKHILIYNE